MDFKVYMEKSEEKENVKQTLSKIPKAHAAMCKGYKFTFQGGNTLHGDNEHIGELDMGKGKVTVAAPWNYGREFTTLHEIGHLVWETLDPKKRKEWEAIVKRTKEKQNQIAEELFCMAYANTYAKNKIEIHNHGEWDKFVKAL